MWEEIQNHVGQNFIFKLDGMLMSGYFCGIGEYGGNYGMIMIAARYGKNEDENDVPLTSCLLVHPSRIKCTLHSNIISLRKSCRNLFEKLKLTNNLDSIYYPPFEITEMTDGKRIKTGK